jgi:hypothetical protein
MNDPKITERKEMWRWKMIRKVADYINNPDDVTMSELKALIESYRSHNDIQDMIQSLKYN